MGSVDDPLFRNFEAFVAADSDDWYFTSVVPPNLSKVDVRDLPTLGHLCRVLSSVLNRAPNYTIEAHNCYFLCHMIMLGLLELCAPLPRLTWTIHALHRPVDLDAKVPWHRRLRGRTSRFFRSDSAIIYVRGSPSDHLRAIVIDGWGLGGVSSFYQGIQIHVYIIILSMFALVPPIICGALWRRKKLWVRCTIALAVVVVICILGRVLADRRWLHTLIQLGEVENLIMRDIGLPPRATQFTLHDKLVLFSPRASTGSSHAMLPTDVRRLLRARARKQTWAKRKYRWAIAADEMLLRCIRAVCRMPEPW
ncbi:hypothetical protein FRC12_011853 [Ceratobasidium sp. 428]|nr:hypothetical protein FRC12_011853 [Ceratobasidium sp. 428]